MIFGVFKSKTEIKSMRLNLIKELTYDHGYSVLRSSKTIDENNEIMLELAKQYDEYGYMSEELGRELDSLFIDKNYIIGLHRTGYTDMDDETIKSIFDKGLINNGHIMQGAMSGNFDIERTVSLYDNFIHFNRELKAAHGYKDSQGCIIVKIPKSYLGKADGEIKPIYYKEDFITKLLPEFIYGYVPLYKKGKLGEIKRNPKYRDIHNLENTNLMYDDGAKSKARKQGIELENNDISINDKYEIIKKAYQDTLLKYDKNQAKHALLNLINDNGVEYFSGKENRDLLKKYVIYADILKILSMCDLTLSTKNAKNIIEKFFENCDVILEKNNKLK